MADPYIESDLDGQSPGGYVVMNVDAPMASPYQLLEGESGGYFATLQEAREACQRFRQESGNDEIFVYTLVAVADALSQHPREFALWR